MISRFLLQLDEKVKNVINSYKQFAVYGLKKNPILFQNVLEWLYKLQLVWLVPRQHILHVGECVPRHWKGAAKIKMINDKDKCAELVI